MKITLRKVFLLPVAILLTAAYVGAPPEARGVEAQELKPGKGLKVAEEHCVGCHDAGLITGAELTRSQWDQVITDMINDQGMGAPSPEDRKIILDYLEETQSPGGSRRP